VIFTIALLAVSLSTPAIGLASVAGPQTDPNHADLVIDLGNHQVITRRVTFSAPTITGLEALQRSGLDLEIATYSFGSAICAIEGVGCPASNCFCNPDKYWGYHYWDAGWQSYMVGASSSVLSNGAVDGWAWGSSGSQPPAVSTQTLAAEAALQWIQPQQQPDGSFGHSVGATADVLLAVTAANHDPVTWRSAAGNSLVDFLQLNGAAFASNSAAAAGKLAVAAAAAGFDPRNFAGLNLPAKIASTYAPATGAFGATNQDQAWGILGLRAAGAAIPPAAVQRLAATANPDGGWSWTTGIASDVDSTAIALQALAAAGEPASAPAVVAGLAYLRTVQLSNSDGGFAASPDQPWGTRSNTNSTAFAIQGVLAVGQDPLSASWTISATQPISYLLGQQLPSGAFVYQADPTPDMFATQQAVPALFGKPFPYLSAAVAQQSALEWIAGQQQADGSFAGFNPGATIDAVLAIAAAGDSPQSYRSSEGHTPLDYLADQADAYSARGASAAGKLITGVAAAEANPRSFGNIDLVARLVGTYSAATGQFGGGGTWDQAWAMIGLAAAGEPIPAAAVDYLASIQATGGGWGFSANSATADVDSTALAVQALAAAGAVRSDAAVSAGLAFLRAAQQGDGGFPGFLGVTDAGSTGLALQALAAYGENPRGPHWRTTVDDESASALTVRTPIEALLALQSAQGGFPGFSGANDPFATYQALPGLSGRSFPLRAPRTLYFPLAFKR
jgi:prenyltransferase beta subunit